MGVAPDDVHERKKLVFWQEEDSNSGETKMRQYAGLTQLWTASAGCQESGRMPLR